MVRSLTIIIPTYNNTKGLQYLLKYFKNKKYKIVIVDNKPTKEKESVYKVHKVLKSIKYLPQKKNLGFAKGVNLGAKKITTKWMLILNDDIEFEKVRKVHKVNKVYKEKNTIDQLIQFAEKNKLDAVTPVLRNPDGKVENYGYMILPIGRVESIVETPKLGVRTSVNIDGITAACLLVKTKIFKKLKGFDESFFAYLEDIDLFLRLKNKNFGIAYDIEVLHNHMTTAKTMGNFKAKQDMVNWWRLYFKHPDKFGFNLAFIAERMRNVSGYLKATFKSI